MARKFVAPASATTPIANPVCSILAGVDALFIWPTAKDTVQYFRTGATTTSVLTRGATSGTTFNATEGQIEQTADGAVGFFDMPNDLLGTSLNSAGPHTFIAIYEVSAEYGPGTYFLRANQPAGLNYGFAMQRSASGKVYGELKGSWAGGSADFGSINFPSSGGEKIFLYRNSGTVQKFLDGFDPEQSSAVATTPGVVMAVAATPLQVGYVSKAGANNFRWKGTIIVPSYLSDTQVTNIIGATGLIVDTGGAGLTKKLKCLLVPGAAGATAVSGIVFANQSGAIAGAEVGEFTGKTVNASLDGSGNAVLEVPVADFGGSALSVGTTVWVYLKNSTNFSPIFSTTVIEE